MDLVGFPFLTEQPLFLCGHVTWLLRGWISSRLEATYSQIDVTFLLLVSEVALKCFFYVFMDIAVHPFSHGIKHINKC